MNKNSRKAQIEGTDTETVSGQGQVEGLAVTFFAEASETYKQVSPRPRHGTNGFRER